MKDEKRFLQDVGMSELPFPMKVLSRDCKEGQQTIAKISIAARIMHEFEARLDRQVCPDSSSTPGPSWHGNLKGNILEYMNELNATKVKVDYTYPFFVEKRTPVSQGTLPGKLYVQLFCQCVKKRPETQDIIENYCPLHHQLSDLGI